MTTNYAERGGWSLVPVWALVCLGIGAVTARSLPLDFWTEAQTGTAVIAGVLGFNGLVLALSWSAFSKIYELIGAGEFCAFLRRNGLLNHYIVFVGFVHAAQIVAVLVTGVALFSVVLPVKLWVAQVALAGALGFSLYAIKQAVSASTVMHDLIWQKASFDHGHNPQPAVRPVAAV